MKEDQENNLEEVILDVKKITLDHDQISMKEIYETKGWAQLLKFDAKIDDLEIENHIRQEYVYKGRKER